MSAQPLDPANPDPVGEHEVIHLGEHAAVIVTVEEYRVLRELKRNASREALADAEDTAAITEWEARKAAGTVKPSPPARRGANSAYHRSERQRRAHRTSR